MKNETKRPNLLFIICDQQRANMGFTVGWEEHFMPTMTLLKKNGIEFSNAICNTCMCSPSRSTLFTSLYPAQHGVTDTLSFGGRFSVTEPTLDPSLPNLAKMLRPYYDVQFRGKWHLSKGGMNKLHQEKSLMRAEVAQFGFNDWIAPDAGEDIALPNFGGGYANHDALYVDQAIAYIQAWNAREESGIEQRPFALVVSLVNPHDVLSYPKSYIDGGYDETWLKGDLKPPITADEDLMENWKPAAQWQLKGVLDASLGKINDKEEAKNYVNFYGNLLSHVDHELKRLMDEFYVSDRFGNHSKAKKLGEETIIVRLADHGEMGMSHGGLRQKAFNAYEETIRVPFIFSNPKLINSTGDAIVSSQLASLIDVVPTIAGLVGIDTSSDDFKGYDLSPAILDGDFPTQIQESLLFTFDDVKAGNKNAAQSVAAADRLRCVRTKNWKFVHYFDANGSYIEEYELYYIKGIADHKDHPESTPDDPLSIYLEGLPFEDVNLYYADNPKLKPFSEAALKQIAVAKAAMESLLAERLKDIKVGTSVAIRRQMGKLPTPGAIN